MKMLAFLQLLTVGTVLAGSPETTRIYSVCELLANAQRFNGKLVSVRGAVEGGAEGAWLRSDACRGQFYVGEESLQKAIVLSYQSEYRRSPSRDTNHIKRVELQARELGKRAKSGHLTLTYTGVFETRTEWTVINSDAGRKQLFGFGHLNAFPAQLVVVDCADPKIMEADEK